MSSEKLAEKHVAEFAKYCIEQSANEQIVAEEVGYVPNTKETITKELAALNALI